MWINYDISVSSFVVVFQMLFDALDAEAVVSNLLSLLQRIDQPEADSWSELF